MSDELSQHDLGLLVAILDNLIEREDPTEGRNYRYVPIFNSSDEMTNTLRVLREKIYLKVPRCNADGSAWIIGVFD